MIFSLDLKEVTFEKINVSFEISDVINPEFYNVVADLNVCAKTRQKRLQVSMATKTVQHTTNASKALEILEKMVSVEAVHHGWWSLKI